MLAFAYNNNARAQLEFLIDGYEDKYIDSDEGHSVEKDSIENDSEYIYEEANIKLLSYMYWALGLYKTSDDYAVDEFLRINECDLFNKFYGDELEWLEIRQAAKKFIEANKIYFPTRFKFVIPLKLADYNKRRGLFEIQDEYKIKTSRRFELYAKDYNKKPCSKDFSISKGYPRVINMELSRPFTLTHIPMKEEVANEYIKETTKEYHRIYEERLRTARLKYSFRKAYLVLNIKIFAIGDILGLSRYGHPILKAMGILESFAVYKDSDFTQLFYKQSYISRKKKGKLNIRLKEQYEILLEKSKSGGLLNN